MISLIVKYKKIEYLNLLENKFNYVMANILLEQSIIYNFQYGIDMALQYDADYIHVLDKIMKIW